MVVNHIRLDKYLAQLGLVSRRSIGKTISTGSILVDGEVVYKSDMKLTYGQIISFAGQDIEVREYIYLILNKPAGYVCSDIDE